MPRDRDLYLTWSPWVCAAVTALLYVTNEGLHWPGVVWAAIGWLTGWALSRLKVRFFRREPVAGRYSTGDF